MLKKIKVKNFYSIGEEQEISFEVNAKDILDDSSRMLENGEALNLVSCVIGHNASGKTTLLKAITFIFWFINTAYTGLKSEHKIPVVPNQLQKNKPTKITLEFLDSEIFYEYSIQFNQKIILNECLRKKYQRITDVFKLTRNDKGDVEIQVKKLKLNETDEVRFKERGNVPLLSCLIDTGYLPEIKCFKVFDSNIREHGIQNNVMFQVFNVMQSLYEDKVLLQEVLNFVKEIDLGLSDFQFSEMRSKTKNEENEEIAQMLECIHKTNNGGFTLPIFRESHGTQHGIALLSRILPVLKTGGLLVIDEIESGLHPYVIKKLISLFENKTTNPCNAQLIFSTHQHLLMNDRTKTQIFIAEKGEDTLETEIYRLDDVEGVRNDENYFHKYIAGAYGGVPRFDWM